MNFKREDFPAWLKSNQLNELVPIIGHNITFEGLINLDDQNLRSILGIYGLNCNQINRMIKALHDTRNHSNTDLNQSTHDIAPDIEFKSDQYRYSNSNVKFIPNNNKDYPVLPLILPNNVTYDPNSRKASTNKFQTRDKLHIYQPVK